MKDAALRQSDTLKMLLVAAVGLGACTQAPHVAEPPSHGVTALEIVDLALAADLVADARLEDVSFNGEADKQHGVVTWSILRCHTQPCTPGQKLATHFSAPFSTSGVFCNARAGCVRRDSLESYRGSTFLATFTRTNDSPSPQAGERPANGGLSLNRGYYLIQGGNLYHNDHHRLINASYEDVERLLTGQGERRDD